MSLTIVFVFGLAIFLVAGSGSIAYILRQGEADRQQANNYRNWGDQ